MAVERTLAMIKPDAVSRGDAGKILARYEQEGFTVLACKKTLLSAIAHLREVMGATNPEEAAEGTIRALYAENIERNSVHGSDAPETAAEELGFHFAGRDLL